MDDDRKQIQRALGLPFESDPRRNIKVHLGVEYNDLLNKTKGVRYVVEIRAGHTRLHRQSFDDLRGAVWEYRKWTGKGKLMIDKEN